MSIFINSNIFRHLKLEIALAIPPSTDETEKHLSRSSLLSITLAEVKLELVWFRSDIYDVRF